MEAWLVVLMLVVITVGYELAHALIAIGLGYRLKKLYLGIPLAFTIGNRKFSTIFWKVNRSGVEYGISWLILGGAVDFYDLDDAPWWKITPIVIAGPISNLLMAFGALWVFIGWEKAVDVTVLFVQMTFEALGQLAKPEVLATVVGPVGFVNYMGDMATGYHMGWLLVWTLINIVLFVTNILPVPALDGGQVLMSILSDAVGKRRRKYIRWVTLATLYLLCGLMLLVFAKDIVVGINFFLGR